MTVEITAPTEFQGTVISGINKRKGLVISTDNIGDNFVCIAEVPLNSMFGYSTDLRSNTQGKGEFVMEYKNHQPVTKDQQNQLIEEFKKKQQEARK
jgi:elongation factor G